MTQPEKFGDPAYSLTRHLTDVDFDATVKKTRDALAAEGFGVLTEIDVQTTFAKKLDVTWRRCLILGACNPTLAHQALSVEPGIAVLLPCNVVVGEDKDGTVVVSAIDPIKMFSVVQRADVEPIATDVRDRLTRVLEAL